MGTVPVCGIMNQLLYYDALATLYLQNYFYRLPYMETVAMVVTSLGDPRYCYVVTFPIVYWLLGAAAGHHVLLTASVAEWSNIVLKWLLLGNRPYWWVWLHTDWPHLLHQSPVTCETGPGNPSGHVMITLAVLLTCADYVERWRETERKKTDCPNTTVGNSTEKEKSSNGQEVDDHRDGMPVGHRGRVVRDSLSENHWFFFLRSNFRHLVWLIVSAIAVSRLLISSHFIYQIICGLFVGVVIHKLTAYCLRSRHSGTNHARLQWWRILALSPFMVVSSLFLFHVWTWLGMDPGFSIALAERYCANKEWVRLDTTPYFSLMRAAGTVVGVAIMTALRPFALNSPTNSFLKKGVKIVTSFALIGCLGAIPMATGTNMFYMQSLCMCAAVPVMVGCVQMYW